jgi:hypothetical protein
MSRTGTLIVVGVLTIIAPYSGLPLMLRDLLVVVFGALVTGIALSLRAKEARDARERAAADTPASEAVVGVPSPEEREENR